MLRMTPITTRKKKKTKQQQQQQQQQQRLSHPPFHTIIIEDTIRHNIAQMTPASKAYISCLLATIIK